MVRSDALLSTGLLNEDSAYNWSVASLLAGREDYVADLSFVNCLKLLFQLIERLEGALRNLQ
jgi:hypothetical protein